MSGPEDYPSEPIPLTGCRLHVYLADGYWCVWLNTEAGDFDGLCVATETTLAAALAEAQKAFVCAGLFVARLLAREREK